jgi:cold shock CspA family protein
MTDARHTGRVRYVHEVGYGFARPDGRIAGAAGELFLSITAVETLGLQVHDHISFEVEPERGKPGKFRAVKITRLPID